MLTPQLVLTSGDAIGLSEKGIFSNTGIRTATLTSLTSARLVGWKIKDFANLFYQYPLLWSLLEEKLELILRINFIEKVAIFTDLNKTQILKLAKNIQKKSFSAGAFIFKKGDVAEECYLIEKGRVEITISDQKPPIILESPAIFGEMALLSNNTRNATAKMLDHGSLLMLDKKTFEFLMHAHTNITESILCLTFERNRPLRVTEVQEYTSISPEGQTLTILKNMNLKHYYKLSPLGVMVWQKFDGLHSIEEIVEYVLNQYGRAAAENVYDIIFNLHDLGFIYFPSIIDTFAPEKSSAASPLAALPAQNDKFHQLKKFLKNLMTLKFVFPHVDRTITVLYEKFVYLFFKPLSLLILLSIAIVGLCISPFNLLNIWSSSKPLNSPLILMTAIFFTNLFLIVIHELAHAFTVKFFGREINKAGVVFYWIGLFAFVDTSDMWLSNKKARISVDLAGPLMDFVLAGIASLCAFAMSSIALKFYFSGLSLVLYYGVLKNLIPVDENDGYHALKSYSGNSKLFNQAIKFLKNLTFKDICDKKKRSAHRFEFIYWLIFGICALLSVLIACGAQLLIRKMLPATFFGLSSAYLSWLLPVMVVIFFTVKFLNCLCRPLKE